MHVMEEVVGEAGDDGGGGGGEEGEWAGDLLWWGEAAEVERPEFLVWREVGEAELKQVPGMEEGEGEEGLLGLLLTVEEEGVELNCGGVEEEEEDHCEKGVAEAPASSAHSSRLLRLPSSQ